MIQYLINNVAGFFRRIYNICMFCENNENKKQKPIYLINNEPYLKLDDEPVNNEMVVLGEKKINKGEWMEFK